MLTPKTNAYVQAGIVFTRVYRPNGTDAQVKETEAVFTLADAKAKLAAGWYPEKPNVAFDLLAALIEDVKAG